MPPPSLTSPILNPTYANLSIYEFLHTIEAKDPWHQVVQFTLSFTEKGYLNLGEIFHMDANTIEATVDMPEGTVQLV